MTGPVTVTGSGTIVLGDLISCDGFHYGCPIRVQTHVHVDHMNDFDSSKGFQDIVLSRASYELLCREFDADLPYRENIHPLAYGEAISLKGCEITLLSSGHMLGAAQVQVRLPDGLVAGYSGDFGWPLEHTISVDALVVDSTYGSPRRRREYNQAEVECRLRELVADTSRRGPVHLKAHRGTLQRALQVLDGTLTTPIVASRRVCSELEIYRKFGVSVPPVLELGTADFGQGDPYVRLYSRGDRWPIDDLGGTSIILSAQMSSVTDPVLQYSDSAFCVALSDHADFDGTLAYIQATGARLVLTDNTRGHGLELAREVGQRLSVQACCEPLDMSGRRLWGV